MPKQTDKDIDETPLNSQMSQNKNGIIAFLFQLGEPWNPSGCLDLIVLSFSTS